MQSAHPVAASLPGLVAARVLDAQLAALVWLLLERGVPLLVAGRDPDARSALTDAFVGALPPERRPDAASGGDRLVRVAGTLDAATPPGIIRAALAATSGRSGLLATLDADDLAGALDLLSRQGLTIDEVSFLGVVLVLGPPGVDHPRVQVAHYLRPVARDAGGHTRRQGPAVLASWDPREQRWEDFAWAIVPDLGARCRMRVADFVMEHGARTTLLAGRP